ncbi:MAG: hypothetical protein QNK23_05260 [Crocinitomicaceae bacterium]|nr:hypothetical protein [Crocinitomicaceae bacterium]
MKSQSSSGKNALGNNRYFDPKAGFFGGLVIGLVVFWINSHHPFNQAVVAGLKQFTYTFFMGGFIARVCENIAIKYNPALKAILMAIFIPGVSTICLTYGLHSMKGTPEPFLSTIPTMVAVPIVLTVWSFKKRKEMK